MGEVIDLFKMNMLKVEEVSRILNLSKMTVYRLINSGELEGVRFGRTFRIREDELRRFIADAKVVPGSLQWANQITDDEADIPVEED